MHLWKPLMSLCLIASLTACGDKEPDDADGDGLSGRVNRVWDQQAHTIAIGRFGWKANQPSLRQQAAEAFRAALEHDPNDAVLLGLDTLHRTGIDRRNSRIALARRLENDSGSTASMRLDRIDENYRQGRLQAALPLARLAAFHHPTELLNF